MWLISTQEAIVLTGMRRTGKTTILRYYYDRLQTDNKLFIDLENILNRRYFQEANYEAIRHNLEFLGLDLSHPAFVFIDEIQFVSNLPSVVKYLIDHYGVKFFLTGSASFYLKGLFAESLAGRKVLFEIFPLTFREFLAFKGERFQLPEAPFYISDEVYGTLMPLYDEYVCVYQNLHTRGEIHYYQRKSGVEIDFILNKESAYEVKLSADMNDFRRLKILANDLGLKGYYLVSKKKGKQQSGGVLYGFMVG